LLDCVNTLLRMVIQYSGVRQWIFLQRGAKKSSPNRVLIFMTRTRWIRTHDILERRKTRSPAVATIADRTGCH